MYFRLRLRYTTQQPSCILLDTLAAKTTTTTVRVQLCASVLFERVEVYGMPRRTMTKKIESAGHSEAFYVDDNDSEVRSRAHVCGCVRHGWCSSNLTTRPLKKKAPPKMGISCTVTRIEWLAASKQCGLPKCPVPVRWEPEGGLNLEKLGHSLTFRFALFVSPTSPPLHNLQSQTTSIRHASESIRLQASSPGQHRQPM